MMKIVSKTRRFAVLPIVASVAALSACGSSGELAKTNPTYFNAKISDGKLTGSYNPAGFNADEVQALLKSNCAGGRLAAYGEQPGDGLIAFTASCEGGLSAAGGNIEFERGAAGVTTETMTYDSNGNLSTNTGSVKL